MILTIIIGLAFALAFIFFTSSSITAMRYAGAYPFAMIVFGLLFIYLFVAASSDVLKWINGILFLSCGFACMQDVEKIRRKHKSQKNEKTQPERNTVLTEQARTASQPKIDEASGSREDGDNSSKVMADGAKAEANTNDHKTRLGYNSENS